LGEMTRKKSWIGCWRRPVRSWLLSMGWRLTDEYSLFYLTWIEPNRMTGKKVWLTKSSGQKWKIWCGYAFENLCLSHVPQIK